MVEAAAANFVWAAPIAFGLVIGLVEAFFVHNDESGMGWMKHATHAIPTCIIFTFFSMNVPFVVHWLNQSWLNGPIAIYGIPVVIGIITAVKVKAAAAIAKGGTIGESLPHALVIGLLVAISPFVFSAIAPSLPAILKQ